MIPQNVGGPPGTGTCSRNCGRVSRNLTCPAGRQADDATFNLGQRAVGFDRWSWKFGPAAGAWPQVEETAFGIVFGETEAPSADCAPAKGARIW